MPAAGPYPDPAQSSLCLHTILPHIYFNSNLPSVLISCQFSSLLDHLTKLLYALGYLVVQLVEALHYKMEGPRFNSRWCHRNFSLT